MQDCIFFVLTFFLQCAGAALIMGAMKAERVQLRIEPELKAVFLRAASFSHQSLSQFLIQSGRLGVEEARRRGSRMKPAPESRDARRGLGRRRRTPEAGRMVGGGMVGTQAT